MGMLGGMVAGGIAVLAYQQFRKGHERLPDLEAPVRAAGDVVAKVADSVTSRIGVSGDGQSKEATTTVIASPTKFHREDCRYARDDRRLSRDEALAEGLEPCSVCEP